MKPARVIQIAESAGWAGGEVYLLNLAKALDRHRFNLGVVVPERGPLVEQLRAQGVQVHFVPLTERLFNPSRLFALIGLFRRERPVIVQSHGARSNVYTKLAGRLARVPVVLSTVHNSLFAYEVSALRKRLYVLAEKVTSPLADRILAVSAAIADDLVRRYGIRAERVVTIRNGIDTEAYRPSRDPGDILAELNLKEAGPLIGVAARMTPQKGHLFLLRALSLLIPRFPRLRCLLIGDGPLRQALLRECEALGVIDHCRFTGVRTDVPDLLSVLQVVVLPSLSEGLPFVLLETMALGKPIVATNVGGVCEVMEDGITGLLVPPRDPKALAHAIAFLLDRPGKAEEMGKRGKARVREHFTLGRMVRELEDVYTRLLQAKRVC